MYCRGISAIPPDLFESELFGFCKGSYTGADRDRPGLIATTNEGTMPRDEIGDMPLAMLVKLLRRIQEGNFFAVGARTETK